MNLHTVHRRAVTALALAAPAFLLNIVFAVIMSVSYSNLTEYDTTTADLLNAGLTVGYCAASLTGALLGFAVLAAWSTRATREPAQLKFQPVDGLGRPMSAA
jgi:uncharacterized membrane protein YjfL (UPF0719 family)